MQESSPATRPAAALAPLLAALCLLFACDTHEPVPRTYTNPVHAADFPDPFVLRTDSGYVAFGTNTGGANVPVLRSDDLAEWEPLGDALPELPSWAAENRSLTWAPAAVRRGDRYVLYYTTRYEDVGLQCISTATSDRPEGPYADTSAVPFICQDTLGGSIDPSPFVDADGTLYLLWKNDGNCCGFPVGLWAQQLSPDGMRLEEEPVELLRYDQAWEHPLIEGPSMWRHDGRHYLLYSANAWNRAEYAVGYAVCETALGPCRKPQDEPIFATTGPVQGPGGAEFFADHAGRLWTAYHAWTAPEVGYQQGGRRSLRIDPVRFVDGRPVIDGPSTTPRPLAPAAKATVRPVTDSGK